MSESGTRRRQMRALTIPWRKESRFSVAERDGGRGGSFGNKHTTSTSSTAAIAASTMYSERSRDSITLSLPPLPMASGPTMKPAEMPKYTKVTITAVAVALSSTGSHTCVQRP